MVFQSVIEEKEKDGRGECGECEHDVFQSVIEEKKKMDEVSVVSVSMMFFRV